MKEVKESLSEAVEQKEEDGDDTVLHVSYAPATESPQPTIIKEIKEMFLRLGFSQTVAMKLVNDKEIDSPLTLASLSDENTATICNIIRRPGSSVNRKMPDRGNQSSILAANNLKLTAFMFKMMELFSNDYDIGCVNSTSVLH